MSGSPAEDTGVWIKGRVCNGEVWISCFGNGAALAGLNAVTAANAGSVTVENITITQIGAQSPDTFDNNTVGNKTGSSVAEYNNAVGPISFVAGADTSGVTNGTSGSAAAPDHETSNYLWGLNDGTTVTFANGPATSFVIWWGSPLTRSPSPVATTTYST